MVRRILEAGRTTFRRYSYEGARVDDIVEQAGISHGAFYLYFRNKEDLLHRMAVECGARLRALTADLESLPRPVQFDDLRDWVGRFVVAYHDDGPVIRVWLDNRDADPLMQSLANYTLGPLTDALARLVAPETAAAVGDPMAGLSMLSLLERLCSYFADAGHDLVIETASPLLFAATVEATVTSVPSART
jgi:AcrR family transcriptional regulator